MCRLVQTIRRSRTLATPTVAVASTSASVPSASSASRRARASRRLEAARKPARTRITTPANPRATMGPW